MPEPLAGPPSAPAAPALSRDFRYEARLWREATVADDGTLRGPGWSTVAWCPTRHEAELVVESGMNRYECQYGEVCGPTGEDLTQQAPLSRYDRLG